MDENLADEERRLTAEAAVADRNAVERAALLKAQVENAALQAALKVAQELTAESSVGEYRAALSLLASTAEVLHSGLRKEREALRIELLKIDELRLSFSFTVSILKPAK